MSVEDRVKKIVSDQLGKSMDEIQSDSSVIGSEKGLAVVFWFVLIGIGIWALLQTHKMIDFLFDLAEEKADISHKH